MDGEVSVRIMDWIGRPVPAVSVTNISCDDCNTGTHRQAGDWGAMLVAAAAGTRAASVEAWNGVTAV
jgi:hypothetical protein